jgi:hypothetical protein
MDERGGFGSMFLEFILFLNDQRDKLKKCHLT